MNDRLSFLAQRNAAARRREREFGLFESKLREHVTFDAASVEYLSFDDTWQLVEGWTAQRAARGTNSSNVSWRTAHRSVFDRYVDCLRCNLRDEQITVILYQRYRFIGGFPMSLHLALANIGGFFAMEEETVMLANSSRTERIRLDWSGDNLMPTGVDFEMEVSGVEWPDRANPCFPASGLPFHTSGP